MARKILVEIFFNNKVIGVIYIIKEKQQIMLTGSKETQYIVGGAVPG